MAGGHGDDDRGDNLYGINNKTEVVGVTGTPNGDMAFVWHSGAIVNVGTIEGPIPKLAIKIRTEVVGVSGNEALKWDAAQGEDLVFSLPVFQARFRPKAMRSPSTIGGKLSATAAPPTASMRFHGTALTACAT